MQNKPTSYTKIISDIKHNKKKILKAAIKVGIRTIFPITLLSAAWALTKGGSKGYKHYKKYGGFNFVKKIYENYG